MVKQQSIQRKGQITQYHTTVRVVLILEPLEIKTQGPQRSANITNLQLPCDFRLYQLIGFVKLPFHFDIP